LLALVLLDTLMPNPNIFPTPIDTLNAASVDAVEALRILRTMDRAAAGVHHIIASNTYLCRQAPRAARHADAEPERLPDADDDRRPAVAAALSGRGTTRR
jgi:hypothetical protein